LIKKNPLARRSSLRSLRSMLRGAFDHAASRVCTHQCSWLLLVQHRQALRSKTGGT
jgi:hypothetical protein